MGLNGELNGFLVVSIEQAVAAPYCGLLLADAGAQLSTVEDLSDHELLRNIEISFGDASLSVADLPVQVDGGRATDVPRLDEHGASIRSEFGG